MKIEAGADEQDVADIFVRVNSGGQKLTEKNFIGTLLAVYDNGVHDRINRFCAESGIPADKTSYNPLIELDPAHIIRMTVGVGFRRARLKYAYMLLRGKNLNTGEISQDEQSRNLSIFKNSLDTVLDLNNWHSFLNIYMQAGYLKSTIISSTNTIVFSYVLYLLGKYDYKLNSMQLKNTYKGLLRKAIKIKNGKIYIVKGEDDELLKTICVYALKLNEDIFPFYLKKFSSCLI